MKTLLDAIPPANTCKTCNGSGVMRCRKIDETEWTVIACPTCTGLGFVLPVLP